MTYYNNLSLAGVIVSEIQHYPDSKGNRTIFDVEYINQNRDNSRHRYHCIAWGGKANEIFSKYKKGDNVYIIGEILNNNYKNPATKKWDHYMQVCVDEINKINN